MELNLELKLKLTTTSPVGWVVGWWVGGLKRNSCQSTQVEFVLEVGFELLNSTHVNVHSIYFLTTSPGGWWWVGGRIKQK